MAPAKVANSGKSANDRPQFLYERARIVEDVAPGEAAEVVTAGARLPLSLAVLLPRMPARVVAVAVEPDGQPAARPATVDETAAVRLVRVRKLEIVLF